MNNFAIIEDGKFLGFINDQLYDEIPNNAVPISDKVYNDFINNQWLRSWDNNKNTFVEYAPTEPPLYEVKTQLKQKIDNRAETERLKYITSGVGQSMTYQEKVNQAASYSGKYTAYLADPDNNPKPNDDEYLLLKASLGIDGDTVLEVAETVTYAYLQWQQIGAGIEATRLKAKSAIDAAETLEAARAACFSIVWV